MSIEPETSHTPSYQELQLRALEDQIHDAIGRLGEIYAGRGVSDKKYAAMARRLLGSTAVALFEMQLFPVVRVQERLDDEKPDDQGIVDDFLLEFKLLNGSELYLDLEGTIF